MQYTPRCSMHAGIEGPKFRYKDTDPNRSAVMAAHQKSIIKRFLPLFVFTQLVGCSDDGKHLLSGNATFQGEPIPSGEVRLTPDARKGNSGPAVLAKIKDGRYRTPDEKGVTGGAYVLRVTGYGAAGNSKDPTAPDFGRPLFPVKRLYVDLPSEDYEYDIVID